MGGKDTTNVADQAGILVTPWASLPRTHPARGAEELQDRGSTLEGRPTVPRRLNVAPLTHAALLLAHPAKPCFALPPRAAHTHTPVSPHGSRTPRCLGSTHCASLAWERMWRIHSLRLSHDFPAGGSTKGTLLTLTSSGRSGRGSHGGGGAGGGRAGGGAAGADGGRDGLKP